jgi:ATP-binding cassette subfamily B multidrug efflux pump
MDGGRIVEEGSHREMVERGGLYARLWERQSGGFLGVA